MKDFRQSKIMSDSKSQLLPPSSAMSSLPAEKHINPEEKKISQNTLLGKACLKVGFVSYPTLFQNQGGLQVQLRETQAALQKIGIDVRILDTARDDFSEFDIVHVFSVQHGNEKLVAQARAKGCKVVLSSLLNPALMIDAPMRRAFLKFLESLIGRISRYKVKTDLFKVCKAITDADHIIALSEWERNAVSTFSLKARHHVSVVPNGISTHFFEADKAAFYAEHKITGPFAFCPGQISQWKNQLSLVRALAGTDVTVILAGPLHNQNRATLDACLAVPGAKVVYLGNLDRMSPAFAGAYAAASVVVLPSRAEAAPLVVLESLAAGTPVVVTRHNGLNMRPDGYCLRAVEPFDVQAIRKTVLGVLADKPDPISCRAAVASMSWDRVAAQVAEIYALLCPTPKAACVVVA